MKSIGRIAKWIFGVLFAALIGIQFVPVDQSNPPVESEVAAPPEVRSVLARACYDCHSNQTAWPWYSRIAPVSWQIARDVREGRAALNFSTWNRLGTEQRLEAMRDVWEEVAEGEMPPTLYVVPHPDARLSADDRSLLRSWSLSAGSGESEGD